MIETWLAKLPDYGLAGLVIGMVCYLVLKPMVNTYTSSIQAALAEVAEQRKERLAMCGVHREHDDKALQLLQGLMLSMEGLVRRANGG